MNVKEELKKRGIVMTELETYRWGDGPSGCSKESGYSLALSECTQQVIIPLLQQIKAMETGLNRLVDAARVAGDRL
jgi:hypothetical protein